MKKAPHLELIPVYQVDAFTDVPFRGNPAAVCFLMDRRDEVWMQHVAAEMNLSETAFFQLSGERFHLRWFTPSTEVDLCGHATLATAHIIWETDLAAREHEIVFETRSGELRARRKGDWIELDFPAMPVEGCEIPAGLEEALGAKVEACFSNGTDLLAQVASEKTLTSLQPRMTLLKDLPIRGLIVTCRASGMKHDFVSRFFAPRVGVPEDPVTGSAHCALAPFWSERLGKKALRGFQASARGGWVQTEIKGSRVLLRGKALTVMQGVMTI